MNNKNGFVHILIIFVVIVVIGVVILSKFVSPSWYQLNVKKDDGSQIVIENGEQVGLSGNAEKLEDLEKPDGFEWVECKNIKAAFLKPNGWYVTEFQDPDKTLKCFITKEDFKTKAGQRV